VPLVGLVLGVLIGASLFGVRGSVVGAAVGLVVGFMLRKSSVGRDLPTPTTASERDGDRRIFTLERRVAALEAALARSGVALDIAAGQIPEAPTRSEPQEERKNAAPADEAPSALASLPTMPVRKGGTGEGGLPSPAPMAKRASEPAAAAPVLWSWFANGNTLARIGIVVLFFGIAFLLSYLAEHVTIPIELQFAGVALAGAALMLAGAWLRDARRAYALALVGGGLGVLYLTTFAALELVPLLSPSVAFALLAAISALSIVLSLAFDAQALAALATLGGLLAPVLVQTVSEPLPLFGYVAAVNVVILGVAWFRSWRVLDLVGFTGTFVLGLWWGTEYYEPGYFSLVEPFLAGFFAAYVAVPIVHARRGVAEPRVDAVLTFGVPMASFALQALLLEDTRYGVAWTAGIVAALYVLLWLLLRRSNAGVLATLATAFSALAVIFATLTIPLAVDARWTSAIWAIEAAGVYWIGCREDRRFARGFAIVLQLATGIAFFLGGLEAGAVAFANRRFVGAVAIALSAFASVRFGDRRGDKLPASERALLQLFFAWGCAWWLGGGLSEIVDHLASRSAPHAMLAWVVAAVAVAALLARLLKWPRLDGFAVVLLPALALAIGHDVAHARTTMTVFGWMVFPAAWALHFTVLYLGEFRAAGSLNRPAAVAPWLAAAHTLGALLLLGQIAWEAGEWTARIAPRDTAWAACAHLVPLALYLVALARFDKAPWPLESFGDAYRKHAGTVAAIALGLGFVALAVLNPGEVAPLPYVPLANPLDVSLALALSALFLWARRDARLRARVLYRALGVGAFVVLNGLVARTIHHWLDVPWQLPALVASRPLQAALTLTWTLAALAAMVAATRGQLRMLWLTGAGLLAAAVIKLFVLDLAALSGLTRVVAFIGVGALLLVIGYVAPLPPATKDQACV
jgi:uncharacterized membrane protein